MNNNDVKKALYRQKPDAKFVRILKGVAYYSTSIALPMEGRNQPLNRHIDFAIPLDDMGDASFDNIMESHLLIRYIINK